MSSPSKGVAILSTAAILSYLVSGCVANATTPAPTSDLARPDPSGEVDNARVPQGSPPPEPDKPRALPELVVIEPGEVVPSFNLNAVDGTVLDSRKIVGKKPFVMVFFASWCKICERKLPDLRAALEAAGSDILVIAVALDNEDTWDAVAPYVARHEITDFTLVNGQANRKFSMAYNPFGSVPIVEIIDRNGLIIELQKGWKKSHRAKLLAAVEHIASTNSPIIAEP